MKRLELHDRLTVASGSWMEIAPDPDIQGALEITCRDGYDAAGVSLNREQVSQLVDMLEEWLRQEVGE